MSLEERISRSRQIREELGHPVVDGDGHWGELVPVFREYVRDLGSAKLAEQFAASPEVRHYETTHAGADPNMPLEKRRAAWASRRLFWGAASANTLDRATSHLPRLMAERLDEMGIDVSILHPSLGFLIQRIPDPELRQLAFRALNTYSMDEFSPYRDRLIPVAVIPMETPEEALEELDHAVNVLGFKAVVLQQHSSRVIPNFADLAREHPELGDALGRPDYYALDSAYDYDPVWAKCVELGVAATFHAAGTKQFRARDGSVTNQIFNRVGMLAEVHHRSASAFFLGGVTRRFPTLNVAFLEGGVAWACTLYADLVGLWGKRNVDALKHVDPANLDRKLLFELMEKYGSDGLSPRLGEVQEFFNQEPARPADMDEFASLALTAPEDLAELFTSRFYFGCEGDDAMNALAFHSELLPFGATLKAFYGSDISHWDVLDMSECLEEAFEPVEDGVMSADHFRQLMFENPVRLHAGMNPEFFAGTRVEAAVASLLKQ